MDVNEHERLSNFILRYKFKLKNSACIAVLHITVTVVSSTMNKTHTQNACERVPSLQLSSTLYFFRRSPHLDIFVVLMLLDVYDLISQIPCYQLERGARLAQ